MWEGGGGQRKTILYFPVGLNPKSGYADQVCQSPTLPFAPTVHHLATTLEGGFDGDFAGLASGSICEIEINSTPWQKVQTISFEFRVAGISIRTCHKWETLRRI